MQMLGDVAMKLLQLELDGTYEDYEEYIGNIDYLHSKLRQTNVIILTIILSALLTVRYLYIETYMKKYLYKIHRFNTRSELKYLRFAFLRLVDWSEDVESSLQNFGS